MSVHQHCRKQAYLTILLLLCAKAATVPTTQRDKTNIKSDISFQEASFKPSALCYMAKQMSYASPPERTAAGQSAGPHVIGMSSLQVNTEWMCVCVDIELKTPIWSRQGRLT